MMKIPQEVKQSFLKKGVQTDDALLLIKTDMGKEQFYCDTYTAFTREGIAVLSCSFDLKKREGASFLSLAKSEQVFRQIDYSYFPLEEVEEIKAEEQISVLRVVVKLKNGVEQVLFFATNAVRAQVYRLTDGVNLFLKEGQEPVKDVHERPTCPHCGTPYQDPHHKVCRKCPGKKSLLRKILPFFFRYRLQMAMIFLTVLLSGVVSVVTPYLNSKVLYDEVLTPGSSLYGQIAFLVFCVAAADLLGAVIKMFNGFVGAKVASFVSYDLKNTIFSSFERLSYSFFTSRHTGRLITQVNSDAETLYWFFCDGVPYFLTNALQMLGIMVVMFCTNPTLTLLILIPVPFVFFAYWAVLKMFRRLHAENHTHRSRFQSVLSDVLGGMRIVKAFSREETEIARFHQKSSILAASNLTISVKNHTIFPLLNLAMRLTTYLIWGVGGYLVLSEGVLPGSGISYGELSLFISYLAMLYAPLNFFAHFFSQFANSLNALRRLFEIMETEPEVQEKENAITPAKVSGKVEFSHVNFSYAPGKKTIQDVTFTVPAGKTVGIVGRTGAGKSTLANLLTRLYDVSSGCIKIDDVDLRDLSFRTLRDSVAIVSQETYLFRGTLLDNIRYANPQASRDDVIRAARAAGCHDFIMSFPEGYETFVGLDQKMLSGGEKQRISIARAILKNPPILILDEATAAMDTKTERKIQSALEELTRNRTTITIAHRLSTLRSADFLIVIEDGKVVEEGTAEELLAVKDGVYRKLYRLQMEAMRTIGIEE